MKSKEKDINLIIDETLKFVCIYLHIFKVLIIKYIYVVLVLCMYIALKIFMNILACTKVMHFNIVDCVLLLKV